MDLLARRRDTGRDARDTGIMTTQAETLATLAS